MIDLLIALLTHGAAFWAGFFMACALAVAGRADRAAEAGLPAGEPLAAPPAPDG
jgi:hypothetical protein